MRTTLTIDDDLLAEVMQLSGGRSRAEAVRRALAEYTRIKRKERLLLLRGKLPLHDCWEELRHLDTPEADHG